MYTVYKHTTPSNKVYIGLTKQTVSRRWRKGEGYRKNIHFYRAIKKYGWDNIKHEILATNLSKEDAKRLEIQLIAEYNSTNPKFGYNITKGGDCREVSKETIERIRIANTGKKRSPEQRQRYKAACKNRAVCKRTPEWNAKISKSLIGNKRAVGNKSNRKPVLQVDLNGNFIARYDCAKDAAIVVKCTSSGINWACRENLCEDVSKTKYKGKYKGYMWYYENKA